MKPRAIFALALACRLLWAWHSGQLWGRAPDSMYDDGAYIDMALSFMGRSSHIWITHPPGYAAFLLPFLAPGAWGITLARWAQLLIGAGLAPLIISACRRMDIDEQETLTAGLLVAVNPTLIFFNARIMPETIFTGLTIVFFMTWTSCWRRGELKLAAAAGALGGLASLTRGVLLPFGLVLALTALLRRREQPRWAALTLVCGLAWAATIAPWTGRNWARFHRFVAISVQGGWNLYEGLTLELDEGGAKRPVDMGVEAASLGFKDVFELNDHFSRKATAWMKEHPGEFLEMMAVKAARFWRLAPYPPHPWLGRMATGAFMAVFFGLALAGLLAGFLARPGAAFLAAWVLYLTLLHSIFANNLRYRMPAEPFLAMAAGFGACALWRKKIKKDRIKA